MSRIEYNEENVFTYEINHEVFHSFCSYCYEPHVKDQTGLMSLKTNTWFCSGACISMYSHDNALVHYSPEVIVVLETMRKKFYNPHKLKQKRDKSYNL